jgi:3D-(3,5/4)-trihydroxycyclohexane-1,2-dione acylhydrolase (decyclizing)
MTTQKLTTAQALVKHLAALRIELADGTTVPYCAGVFGIFGHGNCAGLGEALWAEREQLKTYRAHNEQGMAHAAIAFAKANFRQRIMAVTTSIGPGATNLLTAAALAHVNRLPVLLLPGDVFATRAPDPVLQQVEDFGHGDVSANDAFRPLVRYFDRILRPEQLLTALPRAVQVMTDPANCGPVCLALAQDVQAHAFDWPQWFLEPNVIRIRRPEPDADEFLRAVKAIQSAKRPLIVAGGGVLYSQASETLKSLSDTLGVPVAETQAGKSSLPWDNPLNLGAIGVTGSPASNAIAAQADLVIAIGTRLQDFTTGSHTLFGQSQLLSINVQPFDASKCHGQSLVGDARVILERLLPALKDWRAEAAWTAQAQALASAWSQRVQELTTHEPTNTLPYDAEVIGAVRDSCEQSDAQDIVICAAGTLPAELHKLWRASVPGGYHMEYGYSCMGYEIAGALGVKMAKPERTVIAMVGDGSYMMMNSELHTSIMLGQKIIVVVLDNRGFGCIQRLQTSSGGALFNNLLENCVSEGGQDAPIDFAAHAAAMGATAEHVQSIAELKEAMQRARAATRSYVVVIDTTYTRTTDDGGCWWEVGVPQVSTSPTMPQAQQRWADGKAKQRI